MYAYVDVNNDVVALSSAERDLATAQAVNPAIVSLVMNAPDGLIYRGARNSYGYHRLTVGDGSDISHYVVVEDLTQAKADRVAQVDDRTKELIDMGFEFPPASGQIFSLSSSGQRSMIVADAQRNDPLFTYPVIWNALDDSATIALGDAATLHSFVLMAVGTVRAHLDSGTAVKDQIRAAATKAALDAVVDPR